MTSGSRHILYLTGRVPRSPEKRSLYSIMMADLVREVVGVSASTLCTSCSVMRPRFRLSQSPMSALAGCSTTKNGNMCFTISVAG